MVCGLFDLFIYSVSYLFIYIFIIFIYSFIYLLPFQESGKAKFEHSVKMPVFVGATSNQRIFYAVLGAKRLF